jgi:hypothetical protein
MLLFQVRPVSHPDAGDSARATTSKASASTRFPDGSAFLLTLDHKAPPGADTLRSRGETNETDAPEMGDILRSKRL